MIADDSSTPILIAGVDEVGRGALFGPVVAAAVILSENSMTQLTRAGVKDSKKLTPGVRSRLALEIKAIAIDYKIGWASVREIDRFNILQATLLAMKRAIFKLNPQPELCLIDGNQKIPQLFIPQQTIIKGDSTSLVIAAASIVAKVWRDELITRLSEKYPQYDLKQNKGYGTAKHRQAIQQYGVTSQHRQSFSCCQLSLPLN
ncbi:Ribonuclease HII [Planktothrix tepida]|uniref:Ribonuclease HII n=2 Tax=Planktothrix TaxID=54304 RepID=A0A1J1LVJ5_9CYAN|nr:MULTISPECIES: ribonuclease HII [Planktothrix]CAD5919409.1 Ribonuclease HII [Planktothrix pseudagardhii]CAD5981835.1 Ribonuclease HII [Planktothrix tepida]CUR35705.1 Ribonuclease HII [Planktothrix tepida PCC 9214]